MHSISCEYKICKFVTRKDMPKSSIEGFHMSFTHLGLQGLLNTRPQTLQHRGLQNTLTLESPSG